MFQRASKQVDWFNHKSGVPDSKWSLKMQSENSSLEPWDDSDWDDSDDDTVPMSVEAPPQGTSSPASFVTLMSAIRNVNRETNNNIPAAEMNSVPSPLFSATPGGMMARNDPNADDASVDWSDVGVVPLDDRALIRTDESLNLKGVIKKMSRPQLKDYYEDGEDPKLMRHLIDNVEEMEAGNRIVGKAMENLLYKIKDLKARREAGEDIGWNACDTMKLGTFEVGLLMMNLGNHLVRMGDGGVEDPWFTRGKAIHLLLHSDRGTEMADSVLKQFASLGAGNGGVPGEVMESGLEDPN